MYTFVKKKFMRQLLLFILFIGVIASVAAQQQVVPYTLADRDRMIQIESDLNSFRLEMDAHLKSIDRRFEGIDRRFEGINQRFEGINQRFDGLEQRLDRQYNFMLWGFGMLFSFMIFLFGFILWDRRTTLAPVQHQQERLLSGLRELGKKDEKIREMLKNAALW